MENPSYLTPEIQALLGQEISFEATEPVDAGKIRRFAKSLGLDNPIYYDLENGRPLAPPTFLFSVNHDSIGDVDETGRPLKRLSLPSPFGPAMRGGNRYHIYRLVRVGDQIHVRRRVTDLKEKKGRTGVLVFLTYDLEYTDQNGDLLGINTETLIFRVEKDGREGIMATNRSSENMTKGKEIPPYQVTISKVKMMIYAAATWNPYQLHWDSEFSRKRGFADANVAGPMFGDYLAEMLVRWAGHPDRLKTLEYTNLDMAFPGDTILCKGTVHAERLEAGNRLVDCQIWVENARGQRLVEGSATVTVP